MIINILPTPEFQHSILFMCPRELYNEKILKDNIENLPSLFKLYIKENEILEGNKQVIKHLKFESQQAKQKAFIDDCERVLKELSEKMNDGIAPYFWKFYKDIDSFDYESNMQIKADYVLALEK
jgi:hypothetical protein